MRIVDKLRNYKSVLDSYQHMSESVQSGKGQMNFYASELIRHTHSIEKGLSIESPRLGFGHQKQELMLSLIEKLEGSDDAYHQEAVKMALDAIRCYLKYHDEHSYKDDMIKKLHTFVDKYGTVEGVSFGGAIEVRKDDFNFDAKEIEKLFTTRHSIRDFEDSPVDIEKLRKAILLAQRAPSACNRQGVRVHVLSFDNSKRYAEKLSGIGGFATQVQNFILITGKLSSYQSKETNQFIVSASMYAAYLTLTLHLYGIGACVVQRPLLWNEEWSVMQRELNIDEDEQLVCLVATGNYKDKMVVPKSHRLSEKVFWNYID